MIYLSDSVGFDAHEALGAPPGDYASMYPCDYLMSFWHGGTRLSIVISLNAFDGSSTYTFRCVERIGCVGEVANKSELGAAIAEKILETDRFYLHDEDV